MPKQSAPKQETLLALVLGDSITGFSYSFTKAITTDLRRRIKEKKLYTKDDEEFLREHPNLEQRSSCALPEVYTALIYLNDQLKTDGCRLSFSSICSLVSQAEAFLAIFERQQNNK